MRDGTNHPRLANPTPPCVLRTRTAQQRAIPTHPEVFQDRRRDLPGLSSILTHYQSHPVAAAASEFHRAGRAVMANLGPSNHLPIENNCMNTDELRNWATVVAAMVALLVFLVNSFLLIRNRRLENVSRFIETHRHLFEPDGYLAHNLIAMESGTLKRDLSDLRMEARFHLMLVEIERLAILANNQAVPRHTQVYMFGSYTRPILAVLTEQDRNNMFWELALGYLDGLARDTAAYEKLSRQERERFWR